MIKKTLTKTTKLSRTELKEIKNLQNICSNMDGFTTKLYWNILEDRKLPEYDDFLLYIDGNLVGYAGVFLFKEEEAEFTAMIHPKYRHQGLFKALLADSLLELERRQIKKCFFICNHKAKVGLELAKNLNATYSHSEYEMIARKVPQFPNLPQIKLREYTQDDIFELAKMDSVCFETPFEKMVFRFLNSLGEKDRKVFIAEYDQGNIGKIHLRYDDKNKAYIHDLCIMPEFRRRKLGTAMVMEAMQMLHRKGIKVIYLDVEGKNQSAIKMYEYCGFEVSAIYDFWVYSL